jgi:hypothetical protein
MRRSRGLGDVYKRQAKRYSDHTAHMCDDDMR